MRTSCGFCQYRPVTVAAQEGHECSLTRIVLPQLPQALLETDVQEGNRFRRKKASSECAPTGGFEVDPPGPTLSQSDELDCVTMLDSDCVKKHVSPMEPPPLQLLLLWPFSLVK